MSINSGVLRAPAIRLPRAVSVNGTYILTGCWAASLAFGLVLWAWSLGSFDIRQITDVGLASIVPPATYVGVGLLCLSFLLGLARRPLQPALLAANLVALIVVLYGTTSIIEPQPRFGATYKHLGVTDFIMQNGRVDPNIDAYFNWPGFFIFAALLTHVAGVAGAAVFAQWTPAALNLMYLLPVLLIMRAATRDERLVWLGAWLFFVSNWIGQDYFSPQGLNFFLYLTILAVLLTWFKAQAPALIAAPSGPFARVRQMRAIRSVEGLWTSRPETPNLIEPAWTRVGLLAAVVIIFGFSVSSHQLTPFAILAGVIGLMVLRRLELRGLPVLMCVIIAAWLVYMAVTFLSGHIGPMLQEIGNLGSSVGANVDSRLAGSPGHLFVVRIRMYMTVAIYLLGAVGVLRRMKTGRLDVLLLALAFAPFPLVGMQSYGGEMLLRVYLFALAPMAFLAAAAFLPEAKSRLSILNLAVIGLVSAGLLGGFLYARFGNEQMDYFTNEELAGMQRLNDMAPQGSTLLAFSPAPWDYIHYAWYDYEGFPDEPTMLATSNAQAVVSFMQQTEQNGHPAFLVISRSQKAQLDLLTNLPAGSLDRMQIAIDRSGEFTKVFENPDTDIYVLNQQPAEAQQ